MKKFLLATLLIFGSLSIFAACGASCFLANASVPCVSGLDSNPANISARVWIQGLNNPTDGAGTDSDGMPIVDTGCGGIGNYILLDGACYSLNPGEYILLTDWLTLAYDGCPTAADIRAVLLAYDASGKYILESRLQNTEGWGNWDAIGTIPAATLTAETCAASGALTRSGDEVGNQVDVAFTNFPESVLYGSYNGAKPTSPIPTHFKVYFFESSSAPTSFKTSDWVAGDTYAITEAKTNVNNMTYPALGDPNNRLYFSRSLIFQGTELPFVSEGVGILWQGNPPAGPGVIASSSAHKSGIDTVINWTSNDETRVTSYQIYWAPQGSSDFAVIGNVVNPEGNNHTYTATVRIPSQGSYTVKVGANLTDGTVEYSSPMNISSSVIIQNKARVVPN